MSEELFKNKLSHLVNADLEVVVKENRSTMINVMSRKNGEIRLSIHRMFLNAPMEILHAIAHYVRGSRKEKAKHQQLIRNFIHHQFSQLDYTSRLNKSKLDMVGVIHDIRKIYHELNEKYFENALDLSLTWFGKKSKMRGNKATFGLYNRPYRLIKLHRLLDQVCVPEYFVAYILYHEMLHHVIPTELDPKGHACIHGPIFKERERLFVDYSKALKWEKSHQKCFFR